MNGVKEASSNKAIFIFSAAICDFDRKWSINNRKTGGSGYYLLLKICQKMSMILGKMQA